MTMDKYEEEYVNLNGIDHYLLHYKVKPEAPVIIYIHGGPGQSEAMNAYVVEAYAKRNYNVVYYDQRGAGKTYLKNKKAKASMKLLQEDLLEIVLYIKKQYGKEKVGILAHSFGNTVGALFALEHPEHVLFYVGCCPLISIMGNESYIYEVLSKEIDKAGNAEDKRLLDKIGDYPGSDGFNKQVLKKMKIVRKLQGKYGLIGKPDKSFMDMIKKSPIVKSKDILALIFGTNHNSEMLKETFVFDLKTYGMDYKVPVFYVLGENDFVTPVELSSRYFQEIKTDEKEMYLIKAAGHSPMLENKDEYQNVLCSIVSRFE